MTTTGIRRFVLAERLSEAQEAGLDAVELDLLERIVDGKELGASRHAVLAQSLLIHASSGSQTRLALVARFLKETRGAEAPIVVLAVDWLLDGSDPSASGLASRALAWNDLMASRRADLIAAAARHLGDAEKLILFDYSGTVADIIRAMAEAGRKPWLVIAESRSIAGGIRYLERLKPLGLPLRFVFDAGLDQEFPGAQALLLGAESLRRDGALINTLGSRGAARLSKVHGVPVLGCAELIKLDRNGTVALPPPHDFRERLLGGSEDFADVDCTQAELEYVPGDLIDYLLTERGAIRPEELAIEP